jgi:hypothetical protein
MFGINSAYNTSWIEYQDLYGEITDNGFGRSLDYKITTYPSAGVMVGYMFTDHSGIAILPAYARQGQDYKTTIYGYTITRSVHLSYIKLPLAYKYVAGNDLARFYAYLGGAFNILQTAQITAHYHSAASDGNHAGSDAMERFKTYDPCFFMNIGSEIKIAGPIWFNVGLRADQSIMDINATRFRIPNAHGYYHASRNALVGIELGLIIYPQGSRTDPYRYFERR